MRSLQVSTEFQYKVGREEYYKVYISRADGTMVPGSRTLRACTGPTLRKVIKEMQADIDRGVWSKA